MVITMILATLTAFATVQAPQPALPVCAPTDKVFGEDDDRMTASLLLEKGVTIARVTAVFDPPPARRPAALVFYHQGRFTLEVLFTSSDDRKARPLEQSWSEFGDDTGEYRSDRPAVGDAYYNFADSNLWSRGGRQLCRLTRESAGG